MEQSRLGEAAAMAEKAAELDSSEFDVVFNAAHMLRCVFQISDMDHRLLYWLNLRDKRWEQFWGPEGEWGPTAITEVLMQVIK